LVLSTGFSGLVVVQVEGGDIKNVWKSSSLTLLFHGLDLRILCKTKDDGLEGISSDLEDDTKNVVTRTTWVGEDFEFVPVVKRAVEK
jgi:hypothetical protein